MLEILTVNVNSWYPFRDRWSAEGAPEEILSATVLCLQEHKLTSEEACSDAVEWCGKQGWNAVFRPATLLSSGKPSVGVAILCAQTPDVGVTDPMLPSDGCGHRLLGLRLAAPGIEPTIIVSAYLQAGGGA